MVIEKERGKVTGVSPRKIVAKNCKQSTIEKHRVKDTSDVSKKLMCFILIQRLGLEIQLQHFQEDHLICSHGLTLISCPCLVEWVFSLFPYIYAFSLCWKHVYDQFVPSASPFSCFLVFSFCLGDWRACLLIATQCLNFWESSSLD